MLLKTGDDIPAVIAYNEYDEKNRSNAILLFFVMAYVERNIRN
jgi:hypothetical protein